MKPILLVAMATSLISARPAPNAAIPDEPAIEYRAIALIQCGEYSGTAWWIGRNRIITAYHVSGERTCTIGGVTLTRVDANAMQDVAEFTGLPNRYTIRVNCRAPRQGGVHHGVGYAFGQFRHTSRLVATGARDSGVPEPIALGMYVFEGAAYPGMSGGPAFNARGEAVSMINRGTRSAPMMTQGRALADSIVCGVSR